MEKITFRYDDRRPIGSLVSKQLMENIEYLQKSRIDGLPIYQTKDNLMFDKYVINILNYKHINELSTILRQNKLDRILNGSEPTLDYEFLNFWYDNSKNLHVLLPI
jgi:hypothetical protein